MFNIFSGKQGASKGVGTSGSDLEVEDVGKDKNEVFSPEGELHYCYSLSPKAYERLMAYSRLDFITWYKAVWYVQHDPKIKTGILAKELGITWPSAQDVKRKILKLLDQHNAVDIHS